MKKPQVLINPDGSINLITKHGDHLTGVRIDPDGTSSVLAGSTSDGIVTLTETAADGSASVSAGRERGGAITGATSDGKKGKPWTLFKP